MTSDTISRWFWRHARHLKWVMTSGPPGRTTMQNLSSSGQYVSRERERFLIYTRTVWLPWKPMAPLHFLTKFGARRSINSGEEGCENFLYFPRVMWPKNMHFEFPWQSLGYFSKPMGYVTFCSSSPSPHQVWSPSVYKHQRSRLPKFPPVFLVKVAWKPVFRVSMATPWVFLDASIFPVSLGPLPTLSRKPCLNRTKIEEKLKIQTSEFY